MKYIFERHDSPALNEGGGTRAQIACSTCGVKIDGHEDGVVVFGLGPSNSDVPIDVQAIHKGRCETDATRGLGWQDLDIFLRDLIVNTRIDLAATEDRISGPDGLREWGLHT